MKPRLLIALALLAVCAVPALAADHDITLSAATPTAEWEGAAQISHGPPLYDEASRTAIPCGAPNRPCETVLFKVTEPGKFTASVEGIEGTGGTTDVDLYLYKSDESGAPGEKLATAAASGPDSVTAAKAVPGSYLIEVDYYHGYNSGYKGKVKFTSAAPPAAPTTTAPPVTTPPPATAEGTPKPRTSKKAACQKKAKKIKNKKKRAKALKKCKKMKG